MNNYINRKRSEIKLLSKYTGKHVAKRVNSHSEIIKEKACIKKAMRNNLELLPETSYNGHAHYKTQSFECSYSYQRFDLKIIFDNYREVILPNDFFCKHSEDIILDIDFTTSGMSSIFITLLAITNIFEEVKIECSDDIYFETKLLIEKLIENKAKQNKTNKEDIINVKYVCSIESIINKKITASTNLLLIDTTCFLNNKKLLNALLNDAVKSGIPVIMLRSHMKLDSIGMEFDRLGSISYVIPKKSLNLNKIDHLLAEIKHLLSRSGTKARTSSLYPFLFDIELLELNKKRISAVQNNTRALIRLFERNGFNVRSFQHNLFLLIGVNDTTDINTLSKCYASEVDADDHRVIASSSFGFDYTAIDSFIDAYSGKKMMRISPCDLPSYLFNNRFVEGFKVERNINANRLL